MVQGYRDIPEYLCTYIDPAAPEIDERVRTEIVVVVMPMDDPSLKSFRGICRIMNETEPQAPVFKDRQLLYSRMPEIMISLNKADSPPEFIPVILSRSRIPTVSQVSKVIYTVGRRNRVIPVLYQHMIHFTDIGKEKRAGTVAYDICMAKVQI